ncbi:unnamed protein product [Absidia cylindrospora]
MEGLFASEFFLRMYANVYLNGRAHAPRLCVGETCKESICLLLVGLIFYFKCNSAEPVTSSQSPSAPRVVEKFANNSTYQEFYHRFLDDDDALSTIINKGQHLDWENQIELLKAALVEHVGHCATTLTSSEDLARTFGFLVYMQFTK